MLKLLNQGEWKRSLSKGEFFDMGTTPILVFDTPGVYANTVLEWHLGKSNGPQCMKCKCQNFLGRILKNKSNTY